MKEMTSKPTMSKRSMSRLTAAAALTLAGALLGGCNRASAPDKVDLTAPLKDYLAHRGHFCMGMYNWPIVVTDADFAAKDRLAMQLPELEKAGLLAHEDVLLDIKGDRGAVTSHKARRFALTAEGQKYYLHTPIVVQTSAAQRAVHPADLCAATLTLDSIVGEEPPRDYDGAMHRSVLYTYHIDTVPWGRLTDVRRVFPMLDRVIAGEGKLQLREGFTLTPKGWVADELLS